MAEMDVIGARLVRGSMETDDKKTITFDKVKFYCTGMSSNPNHKGLDVAPYEAPGHIWESHVLAKGMTFPGRFDVTFQDMIKGNKFVPTVTDIKEILPKKQP